jgi:hypothetical protein
MHVHEHTNLMRFIMNKIERKRLKRLKRKQKKAKWTEQCRKAYIWNYGTDEHVDYITTRQLFEPPKSNGDRAKEEALIQSIDFPAAKEEIRPAVRYVDELWSKQCGDSIDTELKASCRAWAAIGRDYLLSTFGLQTRIWIGAGGVMNTEHLVKNSVIRQYRKEQLALFRRHNGNKPFHVWLEALDYIIDFSSYVPHFDCPNNCYVVRRDAITQRCYIPDYEVNPVIIRGDSYLNVHGLTLPVNCWQVFQKTIAA